MAKGKKEKKERKVFYTADLELIVIDEKQLKYRINDGEGAPFSLFHHAILTRDDKIIPRNEMFTLDFLNKDLSQLRPYTEDEAEVLSKTEKKLYEDALEDTVKLQKRYRIFKNMKIEITHD